jgi:hypothetical protein
MRIQLVRLESVMLVLLLVSAGCGQRLHPVTGKVTLPDGSPVPGSMVVFEGQADGQAISARGEVAADGSYSMSTNAPGDGVPAGNYRVSVAPPPMVNADSPTPAPFHPRYSSVETPGLTFQVKPGKNEFPIQVKK